MSHANFITVYPRGKGANYISGAALLTVLIMVFVIMAIISNITIENYRIIRKLTNQKVQEQAQSVLIAATSFGRAGLATSAVTSSIDTLQDIWAQPVPSSAVLDDIQMSGYITDEQSKFNVNDLVSDGLINQTVLDQFTVLLGYLNLPTEIGYSIAVYMASPQNEADVMNSYTMGRPAYRPAGRTLIDLSELILVKGMKPDWLYKLSQYTTAIPQKIHFSSESSADANHNEQNHSAPTGSGTIQVNVNTASAEVISAKSGIPLPVAQRLLTDRVSTPFRSSTDITNFLTSNGIILSQNTSQGKVAIKTETLSTSSQYFTIHAIVVSGEYEFRLVTLVLRLSRSGLWPQILWQHPG